MSRAMESDRLQAIRIQDTASGEDLQGCPASWAHRRELLAHVAAMEEAQSDHDRLVRELDVIINGDGAAPQGRLCDIVAQLRCLRPSWPEPPAVEGYTAAPAPWTCGGEGSDPAPTWKCSMGILHLVGCYCNCGSEGCSLSL